jgi:hypothetical protein
MVFRRISPIATVGVRSLKHRIVPIAVISLGAFVTIVWMAFLGFIVFQAVGSLI